MSLIACLFCRKPAGLCGHFDLRKCHKTAPIEVKASSREELKGALELLGDIWESEPHGDLLMTFYEGLAVIGEAVAA
jgi:hypothetical protein